MSEMKSWLRERSGSVASPGWRPIGINGAQSQISRASSSPQPRYTCPFIQGLLQRQAFRIRVLILLTQ
jgi:hypothetical protein